MRGLRGGFALPLLVLATACSPDAPAGAVSADEARQLDEAAAMLDANSVDLNAVVDNGQDGQ